MDDFDLDLFLLEEEEQEDAAPSEYELRYQARQEAAKKRQAEREKKVRHSRMIAAIIAAAVLLIAILSAVMVVLSFFSGKKKAVAEDKTAEATILFTGDAMIHSPMLESPFYYNASEDSYDFSDIFKYSSQVYNKADYAVCTFEGSPAANYFSGHPLFHTPDVLATNLKDAGFDMCLLANNHIYDGFDDGIIHAMDTMEGTGLDYVGIHREGAKNYLVKEINGIKVGMIDYVYEKNSTTGAAKNLNTIDVSDESASLISSFNYNDLKSFYEEAETAYKAMIKDGAQYCIIFMHWGNEYQLEASEDQLELGQELCDIGFDAILGSHPHVVEPVDVLTSSDGDHKTFVAYSVGNLLSNQRRELMGSDSPYGDTEDGLAITFTLTSDSEGKVSLTALNYDYTWVYHNNEEGDLYYILPLDDPDSLASTTGIKDLGTDPKDSIARIDAILKESRNKVDGLLPVSGE